LSADAEKPDSRPYKLTPELTVRVCRALRSGLCDIEQACALEGISRATFYQWRKLGRSGQEPYATFLASSEEAMLQIDLHLHATVLAEALGNKTEKRKPNWKAAMQLIKWRAMRGKQHVEVTGADGKPLGADITHALTSESADMIRRKILFGDRRQPRPVRDPSDTSSSEGDDDDGDDE
jgi:hypothetical protein